MRTLDFRLGIETKDAEKKVEKFNQELEETQQLTELELTLRNADAVSSVKELNEAMEQLQNQALKFDKGSDEFIKAATKAGELKKRMDDVNRSIDTVASGGQLGQITTSFEGLRQSALSFDIDGLKTNFNLLKTQISGAAVSMLGLKAATDITTISMNALKVAFAATGIGLVVIAVVSLISAFDDLSEAGGAIGASMQFIGNVMTAVREAALELLDSLGLIDNEARKLNEEQEEYLRDLEDEFAANADAYDELTRKKTQAEIDYLKAVEEINNRRDISEKRKNDLIELYNRKRIRAIENAETEAEKQRLEADEKRRLSEKQAAIEAEERQIAFVKRERELAKKQLETKIDDVRKEAQEEIKQVYLLEAEKTITEQQQIDKSAKIRMKAQGDELKLLYAERKRFRAAGIKEEEDDFRELQKRILDLEVAYVGTRAAQTRKKIVEEERKTLAARAREIAKYRLIEANQELTDVDETFKAELDIFNKYQMARQAIFEDYKKGRIINEDALQQYQIIAYETFLEKLSLASEFRSVEEARNEKRLAELRLFNIEEEKSAYFEAQDEKLKQLRAALASGAITNQEYYDEEKRIYDETATERIRLEEEVVDAKISLAEAERNRIKIETDYQIAEAQRAQEAKIEAFNKFAGQVQNMTGFISDQISAISNIQRAYHEQRLFEIEEEYTAEYNSLQAQKEAGLITEQQLSTGLAKIEEDRRKAKYKADKKAFEQEKAIRITQAIMSTIQASLAAYSSGAAIPIIGTVMGPVFAAIAAAFGAAQVGMIAAEKFPSYQSAAAPSTPSAGSLGGGAGAGAAASAPVVPPAFYTNSGAVEGTNAMINPGGIYQAPGAGNQQVWVLESDITGSQNQVQVTEDRSYFDAGAYGG